MAETPPPPPARPGDADADAWKETVKAVPAALPPFGKYKLVRELGRGGMGVVYEAFDTSLRRPVALKHLLSAMGSTPEEQRADEARFLREGQICAGLPPHPNLVRVHEAGLIEGKRYLSMEFIAGRSFETWRRSARAPLREQIARLRDVLFAIHHAHEHGVIHRDLKPQNVIVDEAGAAHVLDFGLAKQIGKNLTLSLTASQAVMGTPAYMSPEQARGAKQVDRRTDVWAAGVMLFEVLTDRLPFTGASAFDVLLKISRFDVPTPSQATKAAGGPPIDRTLENICLKALARRLEERYATARDFAQDLERWLNGEAVRVVVPKRRSKRARALWAWGAAGLAVSTLTLVLALRGPSAEAELRAGDALMQADRYGDALAAYGRARGKDPENARAAAGEKAAQEKLDRALREERDRAARDRKELTAQLAEQQADVRRIQDELRKKGAGGEAAPAPDVVALKDRLKAAEEELARQKDAAVVPPPPAPDVAEDWSGALNLLPLMNPSHPETTGVWTRKDGAWVSDAASFATLQAAYEPPEEYDFRVSFTRLEGNADVGQILAKGDRMFVWVMGCQENELAGFGLIDKAWLHDPRNPTTSRLSPGLENGRRYTSLVQVRAGGLKAFIDGRLIRAWSTDYSSLTMLPGWHVFPRALGIGSWASPTAFHTAELREVTGKGRAITPVTLTPRPATPVDTARLVPGLRGEFFRGRAFETLDYRRSDRRILFEWGPYPAWPGGPPNLFSARWTGFLKAPRTGRYRVTAVYDDGVRLVLNGEILVDDWKSQAARATSVDRDLEQGHHPLTLEYYDDQNFGQLQLFVHELRQGDDEPVELVHAAPREAPPTAAALAEREKVARRDPGSRKPGATLLLDALREDKDPVHRYLLLQQARTACAEVADVANALRACDELAEGFDVKPVALRLDTLRLLKRAAGPPRPLALVAFDLAEEALGQGEPEAGMALARELQDLCKASKDAALVALAAELSEELQDVDAGLRAERGLRPGGSLDAEGALRLGVYLAFVKNDWARGAALLMKGRDAALRNAARLEVETPAARMELGSAWQALASKEKNALRKRRFRTRALHWYAEAEAVADPDLLARIRLRRDELRAEGGVELLGQIDPLQDRITGNWTRTGNAWSAGTSATGDFAALRVPIRLPEEYDLTLSLRRDPTRPGVKGSFDLALSGSRARFAVGLGGGDAADAHFLYNVDAGQRRSGGSDWREPVFADGRERSFVLRVRRSGLTIESGGAVALRWKDYGRLSVPEGFWLSAGDVPLRMGAWTSVSWRVTRLELLELSGRARPLR